jgi:hypothetical protein
MCRPSCCDNSRAQGAGVAAIAVIMGAGFIMAEIGPIVARIIRIALEVIRLGVLTTGLVLALTAVTWAAITLAQWQFQRRGVCATNSTRVVVTRPREQAEPVEQPDCLACGGGGTVLKAIGGSRYQPSACPVCEPAEWAG